MNKGMLKAQVACAAVLPLLLLGVSRGFAQHRAVNLAQGTKRAPYDDEIVAGNTLYVAGRGILSPLRLPI